MILYRLSCDSDHRFESWFSDSASYDDQLARGLLSCPVCQSTRVEKAIMAPAVVGGRTPAVAPPNGGSPPGLPTPAQPARPDGGNFALLDNKERAMRAAFRMMRDKIMREGQDVGGQFPDQARRMHDGELPMRPIRGEATREEARELIEDGIMILPIPPAPEELN